MVDPVEQVAEQSQAIDYSVAALEKVIKNLKDHLVEHVSSFGPVYSHTLIRYCAAQLSQKYPIISQQQSEAISMALVQELISSNLLNVMIGIPAAPVTEPEPANQPPVQAPAPLVTL